jgi:LTXXQ motif family protein
LSREGASTVRSTLLPLLWLWVSLPLAAQAPQKPPSEPPTNALSDSQKQALQKIAQGLENDSKSGGTPLVTRISAIAASYDRNILAGKPDPELEAKLSQQLIAAVSEAVVAAVRLKLNAVQQIVKVLTPEQKKILLTELDKPDTNPDLTELVSKVLGGAKK